LGEAVYAYGQDIDVGPVAYLAETVAERGLDRGDSFSKGHDAFVLKGFDASLRDHEAALVVVPTLDKKKEGTAPELQKWSPRFVRASREPEPKYVHGCADIKSACASRGAQRRMPPVSCNDEGGADFQWTLRRLSAYADDSPFLEQRFLHVSSWEQMKRG
jgi:hypothetical protein